RRSSDLESGHLPSLVFHGPPGTGKTTVADIVAKRCNKLFYRINATVASLSDVRDILGQSETLIGSDGILLYIDEIQYFNKKQQQSLLEYVEDGRVTLICSTTENPYFTIYGALLSRSTVFEFNPVEPMEIMPVLRRAFDILNGDMGGAKHCSDEVLLAIAYACGGDARKAVSALENVYYASEKDLSVPLARELTQRSGMRFDRDGNEHYDLLSAFQKSIRGSDENASIYYLARILEGGDLISACRRLLIIACEDIGLAYPMAITIVKSCVDAAIQVGLPEAKIPLAQATILLATSPKSNSAFSAYFAAEEIMANSGGEVPDHLKDNHSPGAKEGYLYPHNFSNSYVKQQYLPNELKNKKFYRYGDNKTEKAAEEYQKKIKG
ncbi:MAG: replication-associated recombination protein A, partial [Eubacteriales bacterium]|nr:replication-associated recombination protein A [Eubacteriales bacterium]